MDKIEIYFYKFVIGSQILSQKTVKKIKMKINNILVDINNRGICIRLELDAYFKKKMGETRVCGTDKNANTF